MPNLFFVLYRRLFKAFSGYILWHNIVHQNRISGDCAVVLLPSPDDEECARYSIKYLKAFLKYNPTYKEVVFLSAYHQLDDLIKEYQMKDYIRTVIPLSKKKVDQLINFYNANLNDKRLIVASLDMPKGRNGLDYLHTNMLSKEEIFLIGLYNITTGPEFNQFSGKKSSAAGEDTYAF